MSINTLQSFLVLKQSVGPFYANQYFSDLLKRCKSATSKSLRDANNTLKLILSVEDILLYCELNKVNM